MNICVIPARGGSKRIPHKNIKFFCGKPMIAWSIEAALKSNCFDRVIVSTDDKSIIETALKFGAEVPFVRPAELSDDFTGTVPVIRHAVEQLLTQGCIPDNVCCIYATAPLIQSSDLQAGLEKLLNESADYAFSVTSYSFPIQRAIRIAENNRVSMFYDEYLNTRSQDLEKSYHDAGQFYWGTSSAWLKEAPLFGSNSVPIILPQYRVQDIDTEEDWYRAELLFRTIEELD